MTDEYISIPSFILRDRRLAALEAIVVYLRDVQNLSYADISRLLNRDSRTIWTTYSRAKKKLGDVR